MDDLIEKINRFRIIDAHMHLGKLDNTFFHNHSDHKVIELQSKYNIKINLCSHIVGFIDVKRQIKEIKKISKKYGNLIYWYLVYNPNNPVESIDVIEKNRDDIYFAGIKIHPVWHKKMINDKNYLPLWEYATDRNIIILSHTWSPYTDNPKQFYANPLLFREVLKKFKDIKIIMGHGGGKSDFYSYVIELLEEYKNLFVEYSGDTLYPKIFRKVIDRIGIDRILFGTDMPLIDIRYHIINILKADISDRERKDIFYNNAIKLFNLHEQK